MTSLRLHLLSLFLLLNACLTTADINTISANHNKTQTIHIVNQGWHTGIIISGNQLGNELAFLHPIFGDVAYYEIGWGDKGFYQADKITSRLAIKRKTINIP